MTYTDIKKVLGGIFTLKVFLLTSFVMYIGSLNQNIILKQIILPQSRDTCPGVLSGLMTGTWETRPLTKQEQKTIFAFLFHAHSRYRLPPSYQREDNRCGNVTFLKSRNYRALCDPKGKTPCCFHNKCVSKTAEECECDDCYDMRNMKHAEYSTWKPSHPGCRYHEHTAEEACDILEGLNISFVGDSLVRHVYTAMLLVVTGNNKDGAMNPGAANDSKKLCEGMNMFTEKVCRLILKRLLVACNGSVTLSMFYYYNSGFGAHLYKLAKDTNPSLIFTGIGVHGGFNHSKIQSTFLKPTLTLLKSLKEKAPKLLWASHHAPGILKSPVYLLQTDKRVRAFNREMESFLQAWNIPIFDTYGLTEGMMSFDGQHYGMGINVAKANLLLSYIKEQKAKRYFNLRMKS